jgi:hypothetical protein
MNIYRSSQVAEFFGGPAENSHIKSSSTTRAIRRLRAGLTTGRVY